MKSEVDNVTSSRPKQFIADNDHFKMRDALDQMVESAYLDVCTAYLDAYGISSIGNAAENGELRLLVGFDLSDIPVAQDIVSFQMAQEWEASGEDPVHRQADEELVKNAVQALHLPSFQVAKAALRTHSKLYVTEDAGIVGSSNLTRPGIVGQRELNLFQYEPEAVSRLREWFASMWDEAKDKERSDFKQELIGWLESTRLKRFAPFHPYAKAIFERYRNRFVTLAASASDVNLAVFQEEGRDTALSILAEIKCCIIADAVGLGKTYIALGAMQRRAKARPRDQREILVICPAQLESVWQRAGHDQGVAMKTESMETLGNSSGSGSGTRLHNLKNYALVIVDEAHNFRNHNTNRFKNLMEVLQGGTQDKEVLLVTATPINNSISDLYSLYRLMTRDRDDFFATTNLRIRSLREFFKQVEKMGISTTDLLLETMVCRSRLDIRRRQDKGEVIVINDKEVHFPNRRMTTLEYGLSLSGDSVNYDQLAATIENLTLGAYNVEQYSKTPDKKKNQTFLRLQTLFRIQLLKRLESSITSFISTAQKLLRFSDKVIEALREGRWLTNDEYRRLLLDFTTQLEEDDEGDGSTYLEELNERDPSGYDIERLEADVLADRQRLDPLINKARLLEGANDGKIARLKEELKKLLPAQKVLIFTSYADTADYIYEQLTTDREFMDSVRDVRIEKIVGGTKPADKTRLVEEFAPKANNESKEPANPIQALVSTDVLSEGQNLQDCGYLINYDLHFNPVRMIQRNGRIDRLSSPHQDITIANFFPEGELEKQLKIVERLQKKIKQIQDTLPTDSSVIGETVRVFSLEELRKTKAGDVSVIDQIDSENPINRFHDMLNEVIQMLQDFGIEEVSKIPFGCQSNKKSTHRGVFVCVIAGKREEHKNCWWLYYSFDQPSSDLLPKPVQEPSQIIELIRSPKPPSKDRCVPDVSPRDINWEIILDAKRRCREMLIEQARNEEQGQVWATGHINKKIKTFFAARPDPSPNNISQRLGRYSLENHKIKAEEMMKAARESTDTSAFVKWLDENLPLVNQANDNPETMPLEVVSYLELIPETEAATA